MKGRVYKRGKVWYYCFDTEPEPLTGKRRQINGSGYQTEKEAWKECRKAIADYERSQVVDTTRRKVAEALDAWLTRIEHSIKPSMAQNWRGYAKYYIVPYIGQRGVHDITGEVCDALYAKLLADGRVKARAKTSRAERAIHVRRLTPDGRVLPCRPHRYENAMCHRKHEENDPLLGQPIESKKPSRRQAEKAQEAADRKPPPGLDPKTVVNTHRMLHRAWEDFATWAGRSVTRSPMLIRRACRERSARPGTPGSSARSCSTHGMTGSSHCGCWKSPRACAAASWQARAGTCSISTPGLWTSVRRGSSSTAG